MKKRIIVVMTGLIFALTACGKSASGEMKLAENLADIADEITALSDGSDVIDDEASEAIYQETLRTLAVSLNEGADANKLEELGYAPDYYGIYQSAVGLAGIGYAVKDIGGDSNGELFIGDMATGAIYDIFGAIDGKAVHVVSGGARDRYYVMSNLWICNEYSGGANESGWTVYTYSGHTPDMTYQYGYKYDGYENEKNPWFTTDRNNEWVTISEQEFNDAMELSMQRLELDFKPLSLVDTSAGSAQGAADEGEALEDMPGDFLQEQSGKTTFTSYDEVISCLTPGQGYAFIKLIGSDEDVLVVTDFVFEYDHSAYNASIYSKFDGEVRQIGNAEGAGSSYPLRAADGILYGGTNHSYETYFISEEVGTLILKDMISDGLATGSNTFHGFTRTKNTFSDSSDFTGGEEEFEKYITERDSKPVIVFTIVE